MIKHILIACTLLAFLAAPAPAQTPSVVVIGIDGMDPGMLRDYVSRGLMPEFKRLMTEGSFMPLETSIPPQSPVAWSNFITGMDPGGHGIFDFIHRDPMNYLPQHSTAAVIEASRTVSVGDWVFPLSAGGTELLRKGQAFWQVMGEHDVPYNIMRVPANYPPSPSKDHTLSGMGTPDILGSYGTFSFYTNDDLYSDLDVSGGSVFMVDVVNNTIATHLYGPENTLRKDKPVLEQELIIDVDPENDAVRITLGDEAFIVQVGEWSPWAHAKFELIGPLKALHGICRFYLRSVRPYFQLYMTPINIDPGNPALPISTPESYAKDLNRLIGAFYTQGMPEDTKALEYGMLTDREFVSQTENVMEERWRLLDAALDSYKKGFLFFYVSTVDQSCHALWRNTDKHHPAYADSLEFGDRFEQLYEEMDSLLAVVRARIPADATLIVMSDHGFAPYYKRFNLNTWLYQEGYLQLIRPEELGQHPALGNVFWRRTRAYAAGINGLYLNKLGREGKGIVPRDEVGPLLDEISSKLLALRDEETGEPIITIVYKGSEIYHGSEASRGPDLVIGYNRGYRGSDESALGTLTQEVVTPNMAKWSGTHLIDHRIVPGVLLSNRSVSVPDPRLIDLPVTILKLYGIDAPAQMTGRMILGN